MANRIQPDPLEWPTDYLLEYRAFIIDPEFGGREEARGPFSFYIITKQKWQLSFLTLVHY